MTKRKKKATSYWVLFTSSRGYEVSASSGEEAIEKARRLLKDDIAYGMTKIDDSDFEVALVDRT